MLPTRLQRNWKTIEPDIRKRWPLLTDDDLSAAAGQPGRLVETIRRRYHRGRSGITIEAAIIDWLNVKLGEIEK